MSSRGEPLSLWGLPIPGLPGVPVHNRAVSNPLKHLHIYWLIWAYLVVLALHLAGAVKHQFDGHPVLWRMVPFLRRPG
jgi:cytochrome b561